MKLLKKEETYIVYLYKENLHIDTQNKKELEECMKNLILKMSKILHQKFTGFYKVKLYQNDQFGLIACFEKEEDLDFFRDLIDLRIQILFHATVYIEIKDYFLIPNNCPYYQNKNKYYINISDLKDDDYLRLCEFGTLCFKEEEVLQIEKYSFPKKKIDL